jgi:fibronectin-binding autotransporter adhesin
MKPKFATSLLAASIVIGFAGQVYAAPIVKQNNLDALNLGSSWVGGSAPGAGDIAVWDATVNVNQTVALGGALSWSGINMTDSGGDITFSAGSTLTLGAAGFTSAANKWIYINPAVALGAPQTWTTPNNLFVNGIVSGSSALTKAGPAVLVLAGVNTLSTGISVTAGQLTARNGAALGPVANALTLANGTVFRYETANGASNGATVFVGNPLSVASASSVTITTNSAANGYSGVITGDAASTVNIGATGALTQCSFGLGSNTQQFGPFLGTVEIFDGASLRFSSTSSLNNGGASTLFDTNLTGNITTRNSGTANLGSLIGSGTLTGSGGAAGTAIFSIGGRNQDCVFGGRVLDGNLTDRKAALTKVGSATLTLTGANAYTGATNVNVGTLQIGNDGTTGSITGSNVNVAAAGTLVFNPGSAQIQTISGVVAGAGNVLKKGSGRTTLASTNTFSVGPVIESGTLAVNADSGLGNAANAVSFTTGSGTLAADAADVVTARSISIGAGATGGFAGIDATDSIQVNGVVGGDGALSISGSGLVMLTNTNTYLGNTTVTSGTLNVTAAGATSSGSVSVTGGSLAGTGSISGATSISSGASLKPGALTTTSSSVGTLTTGALDLNGGSTLHTEFATASSYDTVVVNGDLLTAGASVGNPVLVDLRLENSIAKWTNLGTYNLIQYSGIFTGNANDLFEVSPGSLQAGLTYTFAASGGFITLNIAGSAPSEWNVDANGTWTNAANWLNGVPDAVGANARFGTIITASRTVTLDSAKTAGAVQFNNANSYTLAGTATLTLNATTGNAGVETLAGSHQISTPLSLTDPLDLSFASAADTLSFFGNITGAGGINHATAGNVVLSGTNTFAGAVNFTGGSLTFGNGSLGTGALTVSNSTLLWSSGNSQDISNRVITLGGTDATLNTNGNNVLLANAIGNDGAGNLIKAGGGRLTLAANSTFTGTTTISAGILQLGNGGSTGLVAGTITNNALLAVNLADASVFSNLVAGTGSFAHVGTGSLTLEAQNTFSGTTDITAASATLILSDPLNLQNSTLNFVSSGGQVSVDALTAVTFGGLTGDKDLPLVDLALTVGNNGEATLYSGILSGSGSLTKIGAGDLALSGLSSYTGATAVSAGNLDLTTGGAITDSALTVRGSGRMVVSGGTLTATTGTLAVNSRGFYIYDGSATFNSTLFADGSNGSNASALIKVEGGVLNAPSIVLGRTGVGNVTEPPVDQNLYMTGGIVNISGDLVVGTASGQPNSAVITRVDGGVLTVGGAISVGLNNSGRWSFLSIDGGELVSTGTDPNSGVVLGGPFAGQSAFYIQSGLGIVERIQFGQGAVNGNGLIRLTGGQLYVGAGGISLGSSGTFTTEIRLVGGTLGAKADWATALPVNLASADDVFIKAADLADAPFDITLNGPVGGTLLGPGGLTKTGGGMLTLSGGHAFVGNTTVLNGVLSVTTSTFDDATKMYIEPSSGGKLNLGFSGGDKVAELHINGVPMAAGTWGATGSSAANINDSAFSGTGVLYVGVDLEASGYASWATTNSLTALNNGPDQDPDNDGIVNQLEFVLGGVPLTPSSGILPTLAVNATNFIFTFNREDDSEAEIALTFEYGSNLSGWTSVAIGASSAAEVGVAENLLDPDTITVTIPKNGNTKLFGRLKAVK